MEGWKAFIDDADPQIYEWKVWLYCSLLAASIPIIIPAVQFGYIFNLWSQYNKPVNRQQCSCSCWDTVFKGNNEWKGHENEWLHKRSSWIKVNLRWEIRNGKQKRKFLYIKFQLITRPEWQLQAHLLQLYYQQPGHLGFHHFSCHWSLRSNQAHLLLSLLQLFQTTDGCPILGQYLSTLLWLVG